MEIIFQKSVFDCGLACVCMYSSLYDIEISIDDLIARYPKIVGFSMSEILSILSEMSIPANAYHSFKLDELTYKMPFIGHFRSNHYAIVLFAEKGIVYVADPSHGYLPMVEDDFLIKFSGYLISE